MSVVLGIVMDPLDQIKTYKDSTLALIIEAQRRNWTVYYMQPRDLYMDKGKVYAALGQLNLQLNKKPWYKISTPKSLDLSICNVILMRKDPPFDMNYIYTTYLLELAQKQGSLVINNPRSLRDTNEKLFTCYFPQCCPDTLVTSQKNLLLDFLVSHQNVIFKPLHSMGGYGVFHLQKNDSNAATVIELLTESGVVPIMAQRYIPEIVQGDKRIILIDGTPIPYALARIPAPDDWRGNLAAGATGIGRELTERDRWICSQIAPILREKGLSLVGIDVIGDYLTEINVTSPTGIRELDKLFNLNISAVFLDFIEGKINL
jgi:glutathione synthase